MNSRNIIYALIAAILLLASGDILFSPGKIKKISSPDEFLLLHPGKMPWDVMYSYCDEVVLMDSEKKLAILSKMSEHRLAIVRGAFFYYMLEKHSQDNVVQAVLKRMIEHHYCPVPTRIKSTVHNRPQILTDIRSAKGLVKWGFSRTA